MAVAKKSKSSATRKNTSTKKAAGNGRTNRVAAEFVSKPAKKLPVKRIVIPKLQQNTMHLRIVGDRPLLMNNKLGVAMRVGEHYDTGKSKDVKLEQLSYDEQYALAFYVMDDSKGAPPSKRCVYGLPASGIAKCLKKGARPAGITDNTTIGVIYKSFFVHADKNGMVKLGHKGFHRDVRAVNIGSGAKTTPSVRHRPMFNEWWLDLRITYNPQVIGEEQIVNLAAYAGQYIGLCEMRAEKLQGECGGFVIG